MMANRCLYLFSSDQSPLYAQDILNVLATPAKQRYTFRYAARYLGEGLAEQWLQLQDLKVLVVFSLQQRAEYMAPAFIPIRGGHVVRTHIEGTSYFAVFELGGYASLHEPPKVDGRQRYADPVRAFGQALAGVTKVPYEASASLGAGLPDGVLEMDDDQTASFERTGRYLSNTDAFASAHFVRVLGIKPTGKARSERLSTTSADPTYQLTAGTTYDLEIFHARPAAPARPEPFLVELDGTTLRSIGRPGFDVASRYDIVTLRIVAVDTGIEDRDTVLVIAAGPGVHGPRVELPVRVRARRRRSVGLAGLQALALFAVAVASTMQHWAIVARLLIAGLGALAAVGLGLFGISALRAPSVPAPVKDPPPAPAPGTH